MILVLLTVVLSVVAVTALAIGVFALRRRLIQRPGGTFDCSLRRLPDVPSASSQEADPATAPSGTRIPEGAVADSAPGDGSDAEPGAAPAHPGADHGKGWVFGIARYSGDRIEWFRVFSYAPRPRRVLERNDIVVIQRRLPVGQEELALLAGSVVLVCRHGDMLLEMAMSEDALTGFLAWLEAAPPGQRVNVA
ncbi:DUF2550 domain-containing protein [Yinghuangia seranimata]|uniref:DUF2550 domain-containing protein n=1 Tax=Yinghuangia seranimata TaxID=408067 RepID=UPI00248BEC68|nr:DUF2550 domain-containing protein [Yinghuangia seranimata]MDI2128171.1 DUF2550 domain-containing protein [Yinghuangia seranimata]